MTPGQRELLRVLLNRKCWLCSGSKPDTTVTVECETPNGKPCKPKQVRVHFGCYMDINP